MHDTLRFVFLGIVTGGIYAMVAQGMILIYRGSGLVNFAHGAFVLCGAYSYFELSETLGLPLVVAAIGAIAFTSLVAVLFQIIVLGPMRVASSMERVVATLALLTVLQAIVGILYSDQVRQVRSLLPSDPVTLPGGQSLGADRIGIFLIAIVVTIALMLIYGRTQFGRVTSAVAENEMAAAALGASPNRIAMVNWAAGAGLAAAAGILIAPISQLQSSTLALMIVPALAVGLLSGFSSFGITFAAAIGLGVIQSLVNQQASGPGWGDSVPFFIVIAILIVRGKGLPLRSYLQERLPAVGKGTIRPVPLLIAFGVMAAFLLTTVDESWALAITVTIGSAVICLSVVVVTGYGGQLSLAQYVIAGLGALAAARSISELGFPFILSLPAAAVAGGVVGLLVGIPALRTRGVILAISTLGLAVVIHALVLSSLELAGGSSGVDVGTLSLFGWDIDAFFNPARYSVVALAVLIGACVVVANLRRGPIGRRLLAIRSSERAAAALGISVYSTKLFAFVLGSVVAAVGGAILAMANFTVVTFPFDIFQSINVVTATVVGGVGSIGGALIGSTLLSGGIVTYALSDARSLDNALPLIAGLYLLIALRTNGSHGGVYQATRAMVVAAGSAIVRREPKAVATRYEETASVRGERAAARGEVALEVRGLGVRFGGVTALRDVDITLRRGQVHGLIGPNGAGKTTFIDAVTGFVASTGAITLNGDDMRGLSPTRRSRAGLARSFQSVEIFSDLTVIENLAVGSDDFKPHRYLTSLLRPGSIKVSAAALKACQEFQLLDQLDEEPDSLSFGDRRLVSIARALAAEPDVLLLDEPAAGLDSTAAAELGRIVRWLAEELDIAVLLVEHNLDVVLSVSDAVTVLDQGRVIYAGDAQGVRQDASVVSAYIGAEVVADLAEG